MHWKPLFKFIPIAGGFWLLQFLAQYFWLTHGEIGGALVHSFALAGATLIGASLFSSALFRWIPRFAQYWRIRRYLGVSGFIFILFHVLSAYNYIFDFNIQNIYYSLNPFENPIVFGSIAFPIFLVMTATSTDWAVEKIGARRWKRIHQLVYIAYIAAIFHFILINPSLLNNPPGYLLLAVTAAAGFGQLFWFFKTAEKKHFKSAGTLIGFIVILTAIALAYLAWSVKTF